MRPCRRTRSADGYLSQVGWPRTELAVPEAETMAKDLGLSIVGWVLSRVSRFNDTSASSLRLARFFLKFTRHAGSLALIESNPGIAVTARPPSKLAVVPGGKAIAASVYAAPSGSRSMRLRSRFSQR